ncbi:MAG: ATP-grasp domain-containing protein [Methylococcaceae bacterium]|nr:MAG: ATP-grasp domain-containing protein [Methylococcaceae bacterium]
MPSTPTRIVVLAQSGRLLAQSARRAGWQPWVLDLYGDTDTQACSEYCRVVADGRGGFDRQRVLQELQRAASAGAAGLVYGSDLECARDLLADASAVLPLWGNSLDVLCCLKTPRRFFALLDHLGISYPPTRFEPPANHEGWLMKPACGAGGKGVAFLRADSRWACGAYFQRKIAGIPMSALFLANGRQACLVGFNELLAVDLDDRPYAFAGAHNRADLPRFWREKVGAWLQRLVPCVGLVGLNSLDFMFDGRDAWVLEVNPRPSATLALYDEDFPGGLLTAHRNAVEGGLPETVAPAAARALQVVYAPCRLVVPSGIDWPPGCADLPAAGTMPAAGQPLCSILVRADEQDLLRCLQQQVQAVVGLCRA